MSDLRENVGEVVSKLIDILERAGVAGAELQALADEVNGPKNPDTGLRGDSTDETETATDTDSEDTEGAPAESVPADDTGEATDTPTA